MLAGGELRSRSAWWKAQVYLLRGLMIREAVGFKRTRVGEFHLWLWCRSPDPLLLGSVRRNLELALVARIADLLAYQVSAQAILVVGLLRRRKGFSPLFDATRGRDGASGRRAVAFMGWFLVRADQYRVRCIA